MRRRASGFSFRQRRPPHPLRRGSLLSTPLFGPLYDAAAAPGRTFCYLRCVLHPDPPVRPPKMMMIVRRKEPCHFSLASCLPDTFYLSPGRRPFRTSSLAVGGADSFFLRDPLGYPCVSATESFGLRTFPAPLPPFFPGFPPL